jgi:hypothetical protein
LDEVDLLEINPPTDFILQNITTTSNVGRDMQHEIAKTSSFVEDGGQEFTPSFGFVEDTQHEQIQMSFSSLE